MSLIAPLRKWGIDSLTIDTSTFCEVAMMIMSCNSDHVLVDRVPPLLAMMRYLPLASASAFVFNILLACAINNLKLEVDSLTLAGQIFFVSETIEPCGEI